jgi:hypothetical protein
MSSGLYNDWVTAWVKRSFPEAYKDFPPTVHAIDGKDIIAKAKEDGCLAQVCAAGTLGGPNDLYGKDGDWSLYTALLGTSGEAGQPMQYRYRLYILGKLIDTLDSNDPGAGLEWAISKGLNAN